MIKKTEIQKQLFLIIHLIKEEVVLEQEEKVP